MSSIRAMIVKTSMVGIILIEVMILFMLEAMKLFKVEAMKLFVVEAKKLFVIEAGKLGGVETMKLFVVEVITRRFMEFLIGCIIVRLVAYIMAIITHNDKQLVLCSSYEVYTQVHYLHNHNN